MCVFRLLSSIQGMPTVRIARSAQQLFLHLTASTTAQWAELLIIDLIVLSTGDALTNVFCIVWGFAALICEARYSLVTTHLCHFTRHERNQRTG